MSAAFEVRAERTTTSIYLKLMIDGALTKLFSAATLPPS